MLPLLAITFTSCSDDDDNREMATKLLKKIDYGADGFEYFEYDSSGRVNKHTYTNGSHTDVTNITYANNTITCTDDSGNKDIYTLDDSGYVIKREDSDGYSTTFSYADGYLGKTEEYSSDGSLSFSFTYTWSAGNLVQASYNNGSSIEIYTYNNHENKINFLNGLMLGYSDLKAR
jgi:hypothetical protein